LPQVEQLPQQIGQPQQQEQLQQQNAGAAARAELGAVRAALQEAVKSRADAEAAAAQRSAVEGALRVEVAKESPDMIPDDPDAKSSIIGRAPTNICSVGVHLEMAEQGPRGRAQRRRKHDLGLEVRSTMAWHTPE